MRSTVPALAIAALLLAGCGSNSGVPQTKSEASKPASQVFRDARAALARAKSFHVVRTTPRSLVLPAHVDGEQVRGEGMTASVTDGDVKYTIMMTNHHFYIPIGTHVYFHVNAAFAGRFASKLAGRWLECEADDTLADTVTLTDPYDLLAPMLDPPLRMRRETSYRGTKAVEIEASDGARLYVSAVGTPYPLELFDRGAVSTFNRFNARVALSKPARAVRIAKLCNRFGV